jgi:hypothetical protein
MRVAEGCGQDGLEMDGRVMQWELAMRILPASIVSGPLLLIGALSAGGQSTTLALGAGAPVQLAAGAGSTADKDTFTQKARDEIQEWQRKLHDFGGKAEAKGKEAGDAAENGLHEAWTKAEAASRKLEAAGAGDWESAKASYEKASHELADAWHRAHPDDK